MKARHVNRPSDSATHAQRKKVMSIVYQAKKLLEGKLPRITVRITDCNNPSVLGAAYPGQCHVLIPAAHVDREDLKATVYHEILHAVYNTSHVDGCPLMSAHAIPCNGNQADKLFTQYATAAIKDTSHSDGHPAP